MGAIQLVFALLSLLIFHDHEEIEFLSPALILILTAVIFVAVSRRSELTKIGFRDALFFAVFTWVICSFLASIPIILTMRISITDGVFEAVSALTTTGATILSGLDHMPKTFLLYRQFLQWLGGLGVVVFVVAVLPMLNVGGMKLLKAETPGPIKDDKISPRIANTAHYLWFVYFALTILCALGYYLGGMSAFDAIAHAFTTVSTGGFSTHDASMGHFNSPVLLIIADVFMLLGAISFALHYRIFHLKKPSLYWRDEETRTFLIVVVLLSLLIAYLLWSEGFFLDALPLLNISFFHLISFITSTGYGAGDFTEWPYAVAFLLVFAGYLGGCAGSTAGGNKFIRNILCVKLINLEVKRLIHPRGVFGVKFQGHTVEVSILSATAAFLAVAAFSSMFLTVVLMATGLDFWSSLSAVAACLNVSGPAFGELGNNFQPVSDFGTWVLSGAMILGRLEYFTVLALLLPDFWRN